MKNPPPDHDDFIAMRNAGLKAFRRSLNRRRGQRLLEELAKIASEQPSDHDAAQKEWCGRLSCDRPECDGTCRICRVRLK